MEQDSLDQRIEAVEKRLEVLAVEQREDFAGLRDELSAILAEIREAGEALHRRREDQIEVQMANNLLRSLLDVMPVGVIACDRDGAILMNNPAAGSILDGGLAGDVHHPKRAHTTYRPDGALFPVEEMPLVQALEAGQVVRDVEILVRWPDGRERAILAGAAPVNDETGDVVSGVAVFQDITERRRMEMALQVSETRYRRLFESAQDGILILDAETGQIIDVNPFLVEMLGYSQGEFVGKKLWEIGPFAHIAASKTAFEELQSKGYIRYEDLPLETSDGQWIDVEFVSNVYLVDSKRVVQCNIRDITERIRSEQERAQAEEEVERLLAESRSQRELLERLINEAPVGIAIVRGPDHCYEMVNPYYQAFSGVPDTPIVGRAIAEVFPDIVARGALEFIETVYRTGQTVSIREREASIGPGREQTYWNVDHVPLRSQDGDVESVLILSSEVTEQVLRRKQMEELAATLQSERNILQVTMENTRAHLAYLDPEFNFVEVNSTYVQGCGYSRDELIGRNHFDLFPHAENQAIFERVRDTGELAVFHARPFEFPERPELGITYWDWTFAPVKGADGQTEGLVLSLMDVTQQVQAQAEIESLARFPRENPNLVLRVARDGTILYANPVSTPLLAQWGVRVGQKAPDEWQRRIAEALDTSAGQLAEVVCDERTFSLAVTPFTEKGYANLYGLDISELKQAEKTLQESEGKLQAVFNILPVGISILDGDRNIMKQNVALEKILGASAQELANKQYANRIYIRPDGTPMPLKEFPSVRAYKEQQSVQDVEIGVIKEDGNTIWTSVSAVPVSFSDWKVVVTTIDITARRQAEEALRQRSEFLTSVLESVTNPFYVIDANDYTIKMANSATTAFGDLSKRTTCYALTHKRGRPCKGAEHPCPLEEVKRTKKPAVARHTHCYNEQGEAKVFEVRGYPILDEAGNVIQMIEYSLDITDRRRAEEALEQRNRDLGLLNQLGHELSATRDTGQVIEKVLRVIPTLIASDGGLVWLRDEEHSGWLACKAALVDGSLLFPEGLYLCPGEGIVGWVAQHGESIIIPRVQEDARFSPVVGVQLGFQVHSLLVVPLRVRDQVIGALSVINKSDGDFEAQDTARMETLAASAAIAIENARLQEHAEQAAVAAERSRLARDLHDAVSQTLFSASIIAESLPRLWEREPDTVWQGLDQLRQLTRGALAEMRALLLELRPTALAKAELSDLLRQLADVIATRAGATVSLKIEGAESFPLEVKIALYRIAQEALNNIVKHARATQVGVRLSSQPGQVELVIRDDGCGFDPDQIFPGHLGLGILRERVEKIGATVSLISQVGQGTEVKVIWSAASQA
jgi:PAS domain S-box-containing protein